MAQPPTHPHCWFPGLEWGQHFGRKLKLQDLTLQGPLFAMLLDQTTLTPAVQKEEECALQRFNAHSSAPGPT